ncbi:unnamed protein product [Schistosoma turkestanicum]|nr:unnamed protein product [Schistosoma turkestanicum]
MIGLALQCQNKQCMNHNTDAVNGGNSSSDTNSCKDTTIQSNILLPLKHPSPRQEVNDSCSNKKFKSQPTVACSYSFKLPQEYSKNKLEHSTQNPVTNRINNKMKCQYLQDNQMNYDLDAIHNPILFYSNSSKNYQKCTNSNKSLWINQRKRIYALGPLKSKKKSSQRISKYINRFNANSLIDFKPKLSKSGFLNKNLSHKIISPSIHKNFQIKTIQTENFPFQKENINNDDNDEDCNNFHAKIFELINTIYGTYAFNHFKTSTTNQGNTSESKISEILRQPMTSSNEINQTIHHNHFLKVNNTPSNLSSLSTSSQLSSAVPIKSLNDDRKLFSKQTNLLIQDNVRKHFQKLTDSIFNHSSAHSSSYSIINNDKPLDLRNHLPTELNSISCKNKNHITNDKLIDECEKLSKTYLSSIGNLNSNELWSTILLSLFNKKLSQYSQINPNHVNHELVLSNKPP